MKWDAPGYVPKEKYWSLLFSEASPKQRNVSKLYIKIFSMPPPPAWDKERSLYNITFLLGTILRINQRVGFRFEE